jgi:hypothetical protein
MNCQPNSPALVCCIRATEPKDPVDNMGSKCYNIKVEQRGVDGDCGRRVLKGKALVDKWVIAEKQHLSETWLTNGL